MSDVDWRSARRAWEANPADQGALATYLAARRRAGQAVPPELLDLRLFPARQVTCPERLWAHALVPDPAGGPERNLPLGWTGGGPPLELPAHRAWWLHRLPDPGLPAGRVVAALQGQEPFGLALEGEVRDDDPSRLEALPGLRALRLARLPVASPRLPRDLPNLETLELLDVPVDDDTLEAVARGSPQLARLNLSFLPTFLGRSLGALPACPSLGELSIRTCVHFQGRNLERLAACPHLTRLVLISQGPGEHGLQHLPALLGLRELRLACPWADDQLLYRLARHTRLESLALWAGDEVSEGGLTCLGPLPLTRLEAPQVAVTDRGLPYLPTGLRHLEVRVGALSLAGLRGWFARTPGLEHLGLGQAERLSPEALAILGELPGLRSLQLGYADWTRAPAHAQVLGDLTGLEELELEGHGLGDALAGELARLDGLRRLRLGSIAPVLTDAGLEQLARLPRLQRLVLRRAAAEGTGLRAFQGGALRELALHDVALSAEGVAAVAGLTGLERLVLADCPALDDAALRALSGASSLRWLSLTRLPGVSDAGRRALTEALPACRVELTP